MATVSASWSAARGSSESSLQKLAENILIVAGESTGNLMTVVQMRCAGRTAACRAVAGAADGLETGAPGAAAALHGRRLGAVRRHDQLQAGLARSRGARAGLRPQDDCGQGQGRDEQRQR